MDKELELKCNGCDKHMAILRDAKVRKGMVVYCKECNEERMARPSDRYDIPDFMRSLFR